jgi:phosphonoacetaldehyde hydrolase
LKKFDQIRAVILDWAGTAVDFGSLAPVAALRRVFEDAGVPISAAEARAEMGMLKKDQIRCICAGERVRRAWMERHGAAPAERDVETIFADFLPRQSQILAEYSEPIAGRGDARSGAAGLFAGRQRDAG